MDYLLGLYAEPDEYVLESERGICYSAHDSKVYRSADTFELVVEGEYGLNGHLLSVVIPMSEVAFERYEKISKELITRRLPLLSQYERCRMSCKKIGERSQSVMMDVVVQRLPQGELLSEALDGASPRDLERVYGAVANLERYLKIRGVRFRDLRAADIILGSDGRLYPFRYEALSFDAERVGVIEECDSLRREIEWLSGYSAKSWEYRVEESPYSTTLCDVLGGYISCRAMSEGLMAVESVDGWGFVDSLNRVVVEPKYLEVSDFIGGKAVVQLTDSELYGVIDRSGEYLLLPIYSLITYDPSTGGMILHRDGVRIESDCDGVVKIER